MCGIVGFVGHQQAAPILLSALSRLEYRGYDSAGVAVRDGENLAEVVKATGKLINLSQKIDDGNALKGCCGIGHTRWATHGEPSAVNAHPHVSGNCLKSGSGSVQSGVVGVHNGIIENYQELKDKLLKHDYRFYSDTDTEVVIKLIDYYYNKYKIGPIDAINRTLVRVRGTYALEVMFKDYPDEIYVARKDAPIILGIADGESYIASDVPAILSYTRSVYYIDNLELAQVKAGEIHFYDLNGDEVEKEPVEIAFSAEAAEKGGYEHFMMKEIHEQPRVIRDTLHSVVKDGKVELQVPDEILKNISQVYITGCGSAYHAGIVGQYVIERLTDLPVRVELASEFRYRKMNLNKNSLVVVISQSGETADTLAALRLAKEKGLPVLAIVNVVGSSIAREADYVLYTLAGPEIAVATTKAYSTQLIALYLIAIKLGIIRGSIAAAAELSENSAESKSGTVASAAELLEELETIPDKVEELLKEKERIQWFAAKFAHIKDAFYIGRGIDYAASLEGSLKMKEISYVHSEAYAAGEMKHGTISLIEDGTLVIGVDTQDALFEKTISNMVEAGSRGAYLAAITQNGRYSIEDSVNFTIYTPKINEIFSASLTVVPMQFLGYYVAVAKGLDVDKPRNLAKSVTVE